MPRKNKEDQPLDTALDISWRTRELGPDIRRSLFRKAVPWVKLASEGQRGHAQAKVRDGEHAHRPEREAK